MSHAVFYKNPPDEQSPYPSTSPLTESWLFVKQAFIDSVFPHSLPGSLPDFLFFDNACGLRKFVAKRVDSDRLAQMAVVVDAFHFPGHKIEDVECQTHCNPKSYPVLRREDGSWLFNSSAAEQVNSWFGKLQPKVKEMNVVR